MFDWEIPDGSSLPWHTLSWGVPRRLRLAKDVCWAPDSDKYVIVYAPDSKVHGANMGPIWGRQDPGGPHELCYLGR